MARLPAHRRKIRPALAAAITSGLLGGSLIGLGALGFDRVEVSAASCGNEGATPGPSAGATAAPSADPGSDRLSQEPNPVTGARVEEGMNGTASADPVAATEPAPGELPVPHINPAREAGSAPAEPATSDGTTTAPVVGPKSGDDVSSPADQPPCQLPVDEGAPGPDTTFRPNEQAGSEVPVVDPTPGGEEPVSEPVAEPGTADTTGDTSSDDGSASPVPTTEPARPRPRPRPAAPATSPRGFSRTSPPRTTTPGRTGTITRPEVITRAISWVTQRVPYSQSRWWTDASGTFRQDCSGYIAMAWRTDQRINYWTGNLATISTRIASSTMKPGDILVLPGKHAVMFAGWGDAAKTRFDLFEQYRTGFTPRFVRDARLSYYLSRGYGSYRYRGIRDLAELPPALLAPLTPPPAPASGLGAVELVAATSTGPEAAARAQLATIIAGLPAIAWSPSVADDYTPDAALATELPNANTPPAGAEVPLDELVAAQQLVDQAEARRLAATSLSARALTSRKGSDGMLVLAAGLGLLFLAVPLAASARGNVWMPSSIALPVDSRARGLPDDSAGAQAPR